MEEKAKQIIKQVLLKILKRSIIILAPVIILTIIIVGGYYIFTIDDGTWDNQENSSSAYRRNINVTGSGIEVNQDSILEEALINLGYSNEYIAQIRMDLQNEGYTGAELERKVREKELQLLGIDTFTDMDNINSAELIWELNKELYSQYLDNYEQLEYLMNAELVTQMPYLNNLSSTGVLNGTIYFDRYMNGSTNAIRLTYIGEGAFNELIERNDSSVLNYFTLTESGEVKIGYYQEESGSIETNDKSVDVSEYDSRLTNDNPSFKDAWYEIKTIQYNAMIPTRYSLPFEYLWAMLVMSEDYDFVKGLADLAYNSEIVISIYDNILETTTETEYTYSRTKKDYSQVKKKETQTTVGIPQGEIDNAAKDGYALDEDIIGNSYSKLEEIANEPEVLENTYGSENYYVKEIIYTYTNSIEMKVTYANVWIAEYRTEYNYYTDGHKYGSENPDYTETTKKGEETEKIIEIQIDEDTKVEKLVNQDIRSEIQGSYTNRVYKRFRNMQTGITVQRPLNEETIIEVIYIGDKWSTMTNSEVSITENVYTFSSRYINNIDATNTREKTNIQGELDSSGNKIAENFCSLFRNSPKQSYITDNDSWLFEILENNQETADMIDLTKYLLHKATGKEKYIVEGFNFESIFNTTSIGTLYGGSIEEQLWFALLDAGYSKIAAAGLLGNLYAESGIRSDNLQNTYEKSLGMSDDQYTEVVNNGTYTNFINDSAGYGLAQWTSAGRKQGLYLFAQSKGTGINDSSMQIEYLLGEISQSGGANGYATFQMSKDRKGYSYSSWKDATTIEEATLAFCYVFERPGSPNESNRITYAQMYYDRYKDAEGPSTSIGVIELTGETQGKMKALLEDAVRIAHDNRYGYSQALRNSEFYYDCSSLVGRLYKKHFGISMPSTTANYDAYNQYYIGNPVSVQLRPGDILWRRNSKGEGHVTIYIGNGNYVAAHSAKKPKEDQITVYQDNPAKYTRVYRFIK